MEAEVLKMERETCCVCGAADEELCSLEEHDAAAAPGDPPLRAALLHLNHSKVVPSGRLCYSCVRRAREAYSFSIMLADKRPPPLSEKIRALRKRLQELTEKIDVFIVVGGGADGAYSEDDIITVERAALAGAGGEGEGGARDTNLRGDHVYQCTVCPLTFQRAAEYRSHASSHPAGSLHSCWSCGAQFPSPARLQAHAALHAPPPGTAAPPPGTAATPAGAAHALALRQARQLVCGYDGCILRFATRSNLLSHVRRSHAADLADPPPPAAPPAPCAPCGRVFASASALKRHARAHRPPAHLPAQEGQEWGSELEGKVEYLEVETLEDMGDLST